MRYVVELYTLTGNEGRSIDTAEFFADSDPKARLAAEAWVVPLVGEMIGETTYLQMTAPEESGRVVLSKRYGEF
ncbi:hypothetical protein KUL72_06510 [Bradyrhizobium arachidis]|uniref:hypothetical protein n=1 Tax=Bradyrhizobium TaxID=374 RepID=UPI002161B38D|nr:MULTISPECIES: hypothetical protein [Bradyrhizobium]MDN4983651.1 hypothetical protein [Bradyrhizobium sp. WYCCWR 13022]UVO38031.1 hypothetical protein KUL72_06510 [Bradyrhizobium arachidis]